MHAACSETIKSPGRGLLLQHHFDSLTFSFVPISVFPSSAAHTERMFTQQLYSMLDRLVQFLWFCVFCVFSAFTDSLGRSFFSHFVFNEIALFLFDDYDYAWDGEPEIFTLNLFRYLIVESNCRRRKAVKDDGIDNEVEGEELCQERLACGEHYSLLLLPSIYTLRTCIALNSPNEGNSMTVKCLRVTASREFYPINMIFVLLEMECLVGKKTLKAQKKSLVSW